MKIEKEQVKLLEIVTKEIIDENNIEPTGNNLKLIIEKSTKLQLLLKQILSSISKDKVIDSDSYIEIDVLNTTDTVKNILRTYIVLENYQINEEESEEDDFDDFDKNIEDAKATLAAEDLVKAYLNDIGKIKILTPEEERKLLEDYKLNHSIIARDKLVNSNLRLVVSIAKKYIGRGLPFLDLISEGNLGLMEGIDRFDLDKGVRLSTYAIWWIKQKITRGINDQSRNIRVPVHTAEKIYKLKKARELYERENEGRSPSIKELAALTEFTEDVVKDLLKYENDAGSLDTPVGEMVHGEQSTLQDYVADTSDTANTETLAKQIFTKQAIEEVLSELTEREARVIRLRFGLIDGRERTLEEVGEEFKVTRERARQIEAKALSKLRSPRRKNKLKGFYE